MFKEFQAFFSTLSVLFCAVLLAVAPAANAGEEIEEIVVTGSHIKGTPEDAPLPVTTLTKDELAYEGAPTTLDMIKNLSFSQGADGETDQFQAGAEAERATVNIRGLGPSRSMVLINGRRTTWSPHAIGAQAQLLVDVNMIPSIAVERIEILREGAASTYGSDAIAGVMNFITRSDFTGIEANAGHKFIDGGDGDSEAGVIFGTGLADGRGHLVSSFSYVKRSELELAERDWAVRPYADSPLGGWSSVGRPSVVVPLDRWNAFPIGGFTGLLATGIVDPNCEALGGARTTSGVAGNADGGFCRFQYTPFDNLAEKAERWQWFTEASYDLNDTTTLSAEFLLANSDVPAWNTSPSYPPNRLVDESRTIRANNPGLVDMASKYPELYGDYAHCAQDYCRWAGDPAQTAAGIPAAWQEVAWFYGRAYGQDGPLRDHLRESDLWRLNLSLDGQWGDYNWQTSATYSAAERVSGGGDTMVYRDARARQGLGGFECEQQVPNEYDENGNLAFSLATVMAHAGQGPCQYWIPFSNAMPGSHPQVPGGIASNPDFNPALNNQDLFDYMVSGDYGLDGETSLLVLEAIFGGALPWGMAGGEVNFALGAQWRSETYKSGPFPINDFAQFPCTAGPEIKDCTINRNGLFGFLPPLSHIDEDRSVYSLFGELQLPVSDTFEAQLSLRFEDYGGSTGSSVDPKLAARWQLLPSIGLRASVGTTFRGPTLNQTVATNSSNSLQYVAQTGAFKRIDTKGNPDLEPEEATTFNVGLLVNHDALLLDGDNLFITLDYWSYDFSKPLVTEPYTSVLATACPAAAPACDTSSPYFDRLTFGGNPVASDVEIIDINIINGPDIKTDGIDFTARYSLNVGPGLFTIGATGTRILGYDIDAWELGGAYDALGRLNYTTSLARTLAEWKVRGLANYGWGPLNLRYIVNYVHDYLDGETPIKSQVTHDLHLYYSLMQERVDISLSVFNLTDADPPFVPREMNYDPFTHNPFGRIIKLGLTYRLGNQ